jgi:transposase InsO family protein
MAREDMIMASQEELKRLHVIRKVLEGMIRQVKAAGILSLSCRQIRRLAERVKGEGDRGIVHQSRGKLSNRRFDDKVKARAIKLYRERYKGFGPTLAAEKLLEGQRIQVSDETLRKWLMGSGDWKKARKKGVHRQWRERKEHCGEMVQMDGSHHDWLEGRGPACVLMGYIDDATGRGFGRFYEYEGTLPAMDSFWRYIQRSGIPLKVYLDKHTTYKSNGKPTLEEELAGIEPLSEFERALKELGVEVIHAHSPQAKGRIERFFGTLQDRLVKEMRLRGIQSLEEANLFLEEYWPKFNQKFAVDAKEKENLHRSVPRGLKLDDVFCIQAKRALRNDFTVAYNRRLYQVEDSIRASNVMIHEGLDGSIRLKDKGRLLKIREIASRPPAEKKEPVLLAPKKRYVPPQGHYYRNFTFGKGKSITKLAIASPS